MGGKNGHHRVVITGMGVVSPIGIGKEAFWKACSSGESGVDSIRSFDASGFRTQIAAEVKGFIPEEYFDPQLLGMTDRCTQFALVSAKEAVRDSRMEMGDEEKDNIGVIWGSSLGGIATQEEQYRNFFSQGLRFVDPMTLPKSMMVAPASMISIQFDLRGPNFTVSNTCSSGAVAIGEASRLIRHGYADVVIAGGSDATITPGILGGWCKLRALSAHNDEPHAAVRPFSKDRDGPVLGEGAGAVVVESMEHAGKRSAAIYAEILGYGLSSDAHHLTLPNVRGQISVMKNALKDSGIALEQVDYINAHGTGTQINDKEETKAIKEVFGEHAYKLAVSSTKSMIGHTLGAAGALEFTATVLALRDRYLPPTINYRVKDPECDLDYVPNQGREEEIKRAMTNSFGFGGANATLVLEGAGRLSV